MQAVLYEAVQKVSDSLFYVLFFNNDSQEMSLVIFLMTIS